MADALRCLYVCYLSLEDPLVHTQVVEYLAGLAERGHTIHLLTYDAPLDRSRRRVFRQELAGKGITWHSLRYHKRPSLPATVFDALWGAVIAGWVVLRHRLDAVHARNHVPAATALIVRFVTRRRFIFDLRGLMAEEYADAGRWRTGGTPFRITKRMERAAIRRADGMVVLTERVREHLFGSQRPPWVNVIPCCANLERLEAQRGERQRTRAELGVGERPVLVYVGKFGGWYMEREMVEFFAVAREEVSGLLLLVITQGEREPIEAELAQRGVPASDYRITSVSPDEIGRFLAAADAGLSFIRPCFSKISSSPTKIGEYLGAGLPVISSAGIGDIDALLDGRRVGVLVHDFGEDPYRAAAERVRELLADPSTADRSRALAHAELSLREIGIPRYDALYRAVAAGGRGRRGVSERRSGRRR